MSLTFAWETIDQARADGLDDLLALHWEEVALNKDAVPLAIDWPRYRVLEKTGALKALTMRQDGALIGYDVFFVQPTLHYATSTWALNDILYLTPEARKGLAGARMIRTAEQMLRELGVQKVIYHTKLHLNLGRRTDGDTVGRLLAAMGYTHVENVWAKML